MSQASESLEIAELTDDDRFTLELGKEMLRESISVGREFCKFMIGFATGAVPVYLSLVSLYLPDQYGFSPIAQVLIGAPVLVFMVSSIFFVFGYMPTTDPLSLDDISETAEQRNSTIKRRSRLTWWGLGVFLFGVLGGSGVLIYVVWGVQTATS